MDTRGVGPARRWIVLTASLALLAGVLLGGRGAVPAQALALNGVDVVPATPGVAAQYQVRWTPVNGTGMVSIQITFSPTFGDDRTIVPTNLSATDSAAGFNITQGGMVRTGWTMGPINDTGVQITRCWSPIMARRLW